MSLLDKIAALEKPEQKFVTVDVSHVFKEEPATTVFTFTEASTKQFFGTAKMANWCKLQYPDWPEELCNTVALMCVTIDKSLLPEEDRAQANIALVHFVEKISLEEFTNFGNQFFQTFPHLKNQTEAIDDAKKN